MDPLQQAAEQLLRAADLMRQVEEQRYDQVQATQGAGWDMLAQRAGLYDQRTSLQGQAALAGTPAGQAMAQQQAGLASGNAVLATRAQVAQSRAQLRHMDTPAGQAETMQQARLQAEQQNLQGQVRQRQNMARENLAREESVQKYGRLGVAAMDVAGAMGKVAPAAMAVVAGFGRIAGLAGHANPNTAATFEGSLNLVKASVGTLLIPAVDAASHNLQRFSRMVESLPAPVRQGIAGTAGFAVDSATRPWYSGGVVAAAGERARGFGASIARNVFGTSEEQIRERQGELANFGSRANAWLAQSWAGRLTNPLQAAITGLTGGGGDRRDELMRSGRGLLAPSAGTGQDYYRQSQMAVLAQGPLESAQLEIQLRNIAEILELKLTQIADSTAGMPDMSSFR